MQQALSMVSTIEYRLETAGLEAKGKLNSWMEGGFEHAGLLDGIQLLLAKIEGERLSIEEDIHDLIMQTGSPRDVIMRVCMSSMD